MTVRELYSKLNELIPKSLSCEWDNDGLLCCPDAQKEVKKILVALDVTGNAIDKAISGGYDVILSHHPFIFKGLKTIDDENAISAKAIKLIGAGISVMSFHTRLDALPGGVNDKLCELLGLVDVENVFEDGIPLGRIGTVKNDMSAEEFAKTVKSVLGSPFVLLADSEIPVHRVGVLGGSGKDCIDVMKDAGADTFVSGRLDYHPLTDAPDDIASPINLIEAGHFYTENPVCEVLVDKVRSINDSICCDIFYSNKIKVI